MDTDNLPDGIVAGSPTAKRREVPLAGRRLESAPSMFVLETCGFLSPIVHRSERSETRTKRPRSVPLTVNEASDVLSLLSDRLLSTRNRRRRDLCVWNCLLCRGASYSGCCSKMRRSIVVVVAGRSRRPASTTTTTRERNELSRTRPISNRARARAFAD